LQDENFDFVVAVVGTSSQFAPEMGVKPILERDKSSTKPLAAFFNPDAQVALRLLEENGVPTFRTPEGCARALKHFVDRGAFLQKVELRKGIARRLLSIDGERIRVLLPAKSGSLNEHEGKALLRQYGIPTVKEMVAAEVAEAVSLASEIGYPVALKILSPQILHKTDAGAVALNLHSAEEVSAAYGQIWEKARRYNPQAKIQGILVQEMLSGGIEVIVGATRDPQFGPVVLFGLGGVFVELFRDVALRLAPVVEEEAKEMVEEVRGSRLLKGFRGRPVADVDAIVDVLVRVSQLTVDLQDRVLELDINPLIVFEKGKGARAVDALVVLS
jgi:acetyltransferase